MVDTSIFSFPRNVSKRHFILDVRKRVNTLKFSYLLFTEVPGTRLCDTKEKSLEERELSPFS